VKHLRAMPLKQDGEEMAFLSEGVKSPYPRGVLKIIFFCPRGVSRKGVPER